MDESASFSLGFSAAAEYDHARDSLSTAEFTPVGLAEALGGSAMLATNPSELPTYLYRTRSGSPRDTLIRLFFLEQAVAKTDLLEVLDEVSLATWIEAGILIRHDDAISARVRLLPYENLYLASDRSTDIRLGTHPNFVMSLGHATELLFYAAIPASGGELLDMATGCGALGLLASRNCSEVLATDINPRAIAFTQFNARLNGITNVEAVSGDMFAPAGGRRFERILCNPPFVITPEARYTFRDSGRRGDEFCREVARAVPDLLADGGYFQMLANCPHLVGRDWRADWQQWFTGLGCDCLVWANETCDITEYAATWIRDTETSDTARQVERYDQWMSYYESQQIEAISYGVVTMRRRSGESFVVIDDADRKLTGPCGKQIEQAFQGEDFLRQISTTEQLLDGSFRLAEFAAIVETSTAADSGAVTAAEAEIQLRGSVELDSQLDPAALELVRHCDGNTPLRQIIPVLASKFGIGEENLASALPQVVIQLARRGYLVPSLP